MLCRGLDDELDTAKLAPKKLDQPMVASIHAPSAGTVEGLKVKVLLEKLKGPLWLELSTSIIEYLMAATSEQVRGLYAQAAGCSKLANWRLIAVRST